jgi:hypothetical protein
MHPLIVNGCSCGHDFDFHLLSWMEAASQLAHGGLHPHWAFTPAWNAGEPRFVFYPPLSWYAGALLGLLLTHLPRVSEASAWSAAPAVFTWIAVTLSGLTMHRVARRYAGANAALLAAAIYMASPYLLFTAYERTAYAELLAAAWMPLLLDGILRERVTIPRIAVPVALLWLTNMPAAVMGCYALALLTAVRVAQNLRTTNTVSCEGIESRLPAAQTALKAIAGAALGLGLAAVYIIPAAYERGWVQAAMATIGGMGIDQNFLFKHTGATPDDLLHDQVLHTASWIAVALIAATLIALAAASLRRRGPAPVVSIFPVIPLALLTAAIAFALTPLSAPLWRHAPEAAYLQFPWRLLAVLAPVCALALAVAISSSATDNARGAASTSLMLAAFGLTAVLALPAYHLFRQPCYPEDTAAARLALFHSSAGTDPTDEYTPAGADNDALNSGDPPYWIAPDPSDGPLAVAPADQASASTNSEQTPGPAPLHLTLVASQAEFLILNLRDYPAWRIKLTGANSPPVPIAQRPHRNDGLMAVPIPAGASIVDIRYARTPDQTAGDAISLLALLCLAGIFFRSRSTQKQIADA